MSLAERFILLETWTTVEHLVLIGVRVILARAPFFMRRHHGLCVVISQATTAS